jgi:hypothetical protein
MVSCWFNVIPFNPDDEDLSPVSDEWRPQNSQSYKDQGLISKAGPLLTPFRLGPYPLRRRLARGLTVNIRQ